MYLANFKGQTGWIFFLCFSRNFRHLLKTVRLYFFLFFLTLKNIIYLFIVALGLHCCVRASCGGFSNRRAQDLGSPASVVEACELSCSKACEIFLDQGLNPCPVHWQVDSYWLYNQGSPRLYFLSVVSQFRWVAQSCLTLCNLMDCSTLGFPVHHQLPEFTQTHVHRVGDAIQTSHPLSSPSPTF